jgi:hypothetical protein
MTKAKEQIDVKVQGLFDLLEVALEEENLENAEVYLGKLSKYFHLFDDELTDYYQYAQDVIDSYSSYYEDDGQPNEIQEWHDFDPDC